MLLHQSRKTPPFGQGGWLYELKFDGYRLVAGVNDGKVVLNTRNGADATTQRSGSRSWLPDLPSSAAVRMCWMGKCACWTIWPQRLQPLAGP